MRLRFTFLVGLCAVLGATAGCHSPSQYVSPRISGRVIDRDTRQPVANVQVRRWSDPSQTRSSEPTKGVQALDQAPHVLTGEDGDFVMMSERSLTLFRPSGWYPVTLAFEHSGYRFLRRSFPEAHGTNSVSGEPQVQIGEVLLEPRNK